MYVLKVSKAEFCEGEQFYYPSAKKHFRAEAEGSLLTALPLILPWHFSLFPRGVLQMVMLILLVGLFFFPLSGQPLQDDFSFVSGLQ